MRRRKVSPQLRGIVLDGREDLRNHSAHHRADLGLLQRGEAHGESVGPERVLSEHASREVGRVEDGSHRHRGHDGIQRERPVADDRAASPATTSAPITACRPLSHASV